MYILLIVLLVCISAIQITKVKYGSTVAKNAITAGLVQVPYTRFSFDVVTLNSLKWTTPDVKEHSQAKES